jgi:hypothetical protein
MVVARHRDVVLGAFQVAWIEVTFERASITLVRVSCSNFASPLTALTRLGIKSARRWYWLMTSAHPP